MNGKKHLVPKDFQIQEEAVSFRALFYPLTRLWLRELLSRKVGECGLLWSSRSDEDASPEVEAGLTVGRFPFCCRFPARKYMTLASNSKQSRRLSFRAS